MKIAIDVGGVLIEKGANGVATEEDTVFDPTNVNWVEGAIDAIRALATPANTLYILSFCGKKREAETVEQLLAAGIQKWIPQENWIFVRNRRLKAGQMVEHEIDVLVDDTAEVVNTCRAIGKRVIHFRGHGSDSAATWGDVARLLKK